MEDRRLRIEERDLRSSILVNQGELLMFNIIVVLCLQALLLAAPAHAQKLEQIVTEAKKEGEVTLVASTSTFGGKKGFAELENLFAKRYGFKAKVNLTGG